jgi:D-xylose transport system permease protein
MSEASAAADQRMTDRVRAWVALLPARTREVIRQLDVDTRLIGLIGALAVIWIGFNIASDGTFLTPRNLWNLSVQSASIGIMACGMVLVIVSRNIDLSVGSVLGFVGYTMAMAQTVWLPENLGLGLEHPMIWVITLALGLVVGAVIGAIHGFVTAYGNIPSFIVTLGGLLVWRGLIFQYAQGQTLAPVDPTFRLLGGGPQGSLGEVGSWALGAIASAALVFGLVVSRRRRRSFGFQLRPRWALVVLAVVGIAIVMGFVWVANAYPWPSARGRPPSPSSTPSATTSRSRRVGSSFRPASRIRSSS